MFCGSKRGFVWRRQLILRMSLRKSKSKIISIHWIAIIYRNELHFSFVNLRWKSSGAALSGMPKHYYIWYIQSEWNNRSSPRETNYPILTKNVKILFLRNRWVNLAVFSFIAFYQIYLAVCDTLPRHFCQAPVDNSAKKIRMNWNGKRSQRFKSESKPNAFLCTTSWAIFPGKTKTKKAAMIRPILFRCFASKTKDALSNISTMPDKTTTK